MRRALLCILLYLLLPLSHLEASGEFQADYDVAYAVSPTGTTIVTQEVILTNKLTNIYPQKYSVILDSDKIKNVIASDGAGVLTPTVTVKDGRTEILLTFNEHVVGIGKKLRFTLRFENSEIAIRNGAIWEITIPGVREDTDIGDYNATLQVPPSFGPNAYLTPPPALGRTWTREQMTKGGISAAYGSRQVFDLALSYFLVNPSFSARTAEIALPPDTTYQKVTIENLSPKPQTVYVDTDGNWIARYLLQPTQTIDVVADIFVETYLEPRLDSPKLPSDFSPYLAPTAFWNTNDPAIVEIAKQFKTPREIYAYVVNTLSYDYSRINENPTRKGASEALKQPKAAVCMEFTDLFIAIARAAGIPARELVGYAHTTNTKLRPLSLVTDVLHAWPEYFDRESKRWIPVDPTWGNTTGGVNYFDKLDFNHIVFAIHGIDSQTPYPAGFYNRGEKQTKDIEVSFLSAVPKQREEALVATFRLPDAVDAGGVLKGIVRIENTGSVSIAPVTVRVEGSPFSILKNATVDVLPPYGAIDVAIQTSTFPSLKKGNGEVRVNVNGKTYQHTIVLRPTLLFYILPVLLALIVWTGLLLVIRIRRI